MANVLKIVSLISMLFVAAQAANADEFDLVMFDEPGCYWCEQWHEEIGPIYPKTAEGRTAPLKVFDIDTDLPDSIVLHSHPVYTPTFILLQNGTEVGKIEGYPGEDFFWWMLSELMKDFPEYNNELGAS